MLIYNTRAVLIIRRHRRRGGGAGGGGGDDNRLRSRDVTLRRERDRLENRSVGRESRGGGQT